MNSEEAKKIERFEEVVGKVSLAGFFCRIGIHRWSVWSAPQLKSEEPRQHRFCVLCRKHEFRVYCENEGWV